jgi:hypothetical protein
MTKAIVLDRNGSGYTVTNTILDRAGASWVVNNNVLDRAGNPWLIFTDFVVPTEPSTITTIRGSIETELSVSGRNFTELTIRGRVS